MHVCASVRVGVLVNVARCVLRAEAAVGSLCAVRETQIGLVYVRAHDADRVRDGR